MLRSLLFTSLCALTLAGCDRSGSGQGTSVTINADGGNMLGALDGKSGEMKIDVPGFSGKIKIPKVHLDATNFDLNGVHLYPGSTIDSMDITGNSDKGGMRLRFTSPATPETVRDWFQDRLSKADFKLKQDAQGLTGTTDEHKPFRLDLTGDGADRAKGTIVLGD